MSIDVNVQNDLVIVTESSEDITVNVSNAAGPAGVGVPIGGTTGQVLKKLSNTNYDTYWALDGGGVPYSGATGQVDLGNYDLKVQGLTIGKGNNSLVNNTALGHSTLLNATTGNFNTAVGYESLRNTTTGQYNTAVGQSSLFSNTTGGQNTALGLNALLSNTTGSSNVAVGLDTLQHITTGSSNTAIGYNAGSHITGGSTPNTTATNSVFIGRDSKANADGQTNQIVIGQNAVGNGSNTATFGNTATTANYFTGSINGGSFVKSGGTSSQFLKSDGSVDSSTYTPTSRTLTINGTTFDLSADRSWTIAAGVTGSGVANQLTYWNGTGSVTGSAGLVYSDSTGSMTLSKNQNASTFALISNTTSGSAAVSVLAFANNQGVGFGQVGLNSSGYTPFKTLGASDLFLYKQGTGDISLLVDTASGKIKFAAGAVSTAQLTLTSAGRLLLGTTTESTFILDVNGTARVSGLLTLPTGISTGGSSSLYIGIADVSPFGGGRNIIIGNTSGTVFSTGIRNVVLGQATVTNTASSVVQIGNSTNATGDSAISIGSNTSSVANSIAIGSYSIVSGTNSINISTNQFGVSRVSLTNISCFNIGSTNRSETSADNQGILNANNIFIGRPARSTSTLSDSQNGIATSINGMGGYALTDATGGNLTINGGVGLGAGTSGDVIFGTATPTTSGTTIQTLTSRWWVKSSTGTLSNVASPNASAQVQIDSTTQGFLPPRMTTTQKNAISSPAAGLQVYDSTLNQMSYYNGTTWINF